MKFKVCPQCGVPNFFIKDKLGNRINIKVSREGEIIPKDESVNLNDYNTNTIYCLGCSWSGNKKSLKNYFLQ